MFPSTEFNKLKYWLLSSCQWANVTSFLLFSLLVISQIEYESPDIICPANQTVFTDPEQSTALVVWEAPTVDSEAAEVSIDTCYPGSGSSFTIGLQKVVCEATNVNYADENMCHFYVNVIGKSHID